MDNFELYHNMCIIKNIVDMYPEGKDKSVEIEELLEQFTKRRYRVAVIGEFKRGKSSLVNTLLGTEILPTDILPTTAVINRIIYDTKQKIVIKFKNGQIKETNIEEIHKYATKLDSQKEKMADSIQEIVVHYPSVFGQNNIELLDTPGLNDNESMSKTTIDILDKIDTAIVVISAVMPLSMTEQRLICDLIKQKYIYHITFVITFIDRISDLTEEQDRIIELVLERIREDTYKMFEKTYCDEEQLLEKAKKILKEPKVFAVSSKLAMEGFIKDDNSLIKKSRFAHFKIQLIALLTANQEIDVNEKAKTIAEEVKNNFSIWADTTLYDKMISEKEILIKNISECQNRRKIELISDFVKCDKEIEKTGFSLENVNIEYFIKIINPQHFFVKHLSCISKNEFSPANVVNSLKYSVTQCCDETNRLVKNLAYIIYSNMILTEERLYERNKKCNIEYELFEWRKDNVFPEFELTIYMLTENIPNILGDIMPSIIKTYNTYYTDYHNKIINYISSWRAALIKYESKMNNKISECIKTYYADIDELHKLKSEHKINNEINADKLMKIINKII